MKKLLDNNSLNRINHFVSSVVEAGRDWIKYDKESTSDLNKDIDVLCHDLLQTKGGATSAVLAHEIINVYKNLDDEAKADFFDKLLTDFDLDSAVLLKYASAYQKSQSPESLHKLMDAAEAKRQKLFRKINQAPQGTSMIVGLRGELLSKLKSRPDWKRIDLDLKHLLSSWFNRGFLQIVRIDWNTPAVVLEKLMKYEVVHKIHGWDDLRRRLENDRRCYSFFQPVLPNEPLIFVEVALVNGLAKSIDSILSTDSDVVLAEDVDTAIFYSINDCQKGLRGISFGDFLIKQVVSEIQQELPNIKTFSTLSPVPGFRAWLSSEINKEDSQILDAVDKSVLQCLNTSHWQNDRQVAKEIQPIITELCAFYITKVRSKGRIYDPVARFHLHNGAQLNRINWLADLSKKGMEQSYGILVNYVYDTTMIEKNHEDLVHHNKIAASNTVNKLAKKVKTYE